MATFDPDIPLSYDTNIKPQLSRSAVVMHDNTVFIESFSDNAVVPQAQIVCSPLTETQRDAVMNFYDTNKDLPFTFNDPNDGVNYTLEFTDEPKPMLIPEWRPAHYTITLQVAGEQA